ncbi:MAG: ribonuclease HII [Candidatus Sungiibacteriota bacterium]
MPAKKPRAILGIDEVGRGALAGPVVVAGIMARPPFRLKNRRLGQLRDSKKLTAKKRGEWYGYLTAHPKITWAVSRVTPRVIDRINISAAANRASYRIVKKLIPPKKRFFVYLDGGLKLPKHIPHRALIKGDERMKIIAASSIIAKVVRDRAMVWLHKKDPRYRFDVHKGYGTKLHRALMKRHGYSDSHRKTFILK